VDGTFVVAWADAYPLDTRYVELTNQVPRACQIVPFSEDIIDNEY